MLFIQNYSLRQRPPYQYQINEKKVLTHTKKAGTYSEVPSGSDIIVYTDDEGVEHEISFNDLINYYKSRNRN